MPEAVSINHPESQIYKSTRIKSTQAWPQPIIEFRVVQSSKCKSQVNKGELHPTLKIVKRIRINNIQQPPNRACRGLVRGRGQRGQIQWPSELPWRASHQPCFIMASLAKRHRRLWNLNPMLAVLMGNKAMDIYEPSDITHK